MFPFSRRHKISFHRPEKDSFHLDTGDINEGVSFFGGRKKDDFSRYIAAGGTRDARDAKGIEQLLIRSRFRFALTLLLLLTLWLLGTFL
jgi:hypothetical protein